MQSRFPTPGTPPPVPGVGSLHPASPQQVVFNNKNVQREQRAMAADRHPDLQIDNYQTHIAVLWWLHKGVCEGEREGGRDYEDRT